VCGQDYDLENPPALDHQGNQGDTRAIVPFFLHINGASAKFLFEPACERKLGQVASWPDAVCKLRDFFGTRKEIRVGMNSSGLGTMPLGVEEP